MVITGIACMVIVSLAMLLRWLFNIDLVGYEEILAMFAFWLYMIGSSYGSYEKSQIAADILDVYLKPGRVKASINLLKDTLTFVLCLVFNYWALQFALWGIQMGTKTPVWRLPMVIGQGSIFVGLTIMSFYNLVYLYDQIKITRETFRNSRKILR